ncbi:hypothetical protein E3N88_14934 [Mikania micrantha]|uniref:Uncharacterized protein n=1 Tax=Mikania micrantha TaxID=192012 RepID=A0A5N6P2U8_9ASTR|nr:hypothetical protein E3N88_14934 [Mikania micrantha]
MWVLNPWLLLRLQISTSEVYKHMWFLWWRENTVLGLRYHRFSLHDPVKGMKPLKQLRLYVPTQESSVTGLASCKIRFGVILRSFALTFTMIMILEQNNEQNCSLAGFKSQFIGRNQTKSPVLDSAGYLNPSLSPKIGRFTCCSKYGPAGGAAMPWCRLGLMVTLHESWTPICITSALPSSPAYTKALLHPLQEQKALVASMASSPSQGREGCIGGNATQEPYSHATIRTIAILISITQPEVAAAFHDSLSLRFEDEAEAMD